ncbi:hypothetical protein BHM03_00027457 [Ensete ventricosum]|nr:hypothetical protein BHM03_00027457 [Ensete ventricosum]
MLSGHIRLNPDHCLGKGYCFGPPLKKYDEATGVAVCISGHIAKGNITNEANEVEGERKEVTMVKVEPEKVDEVDMEENDEEGEEAKMEVEKAKG